MTTKTNAKTAAAKKAAAATIPDPAQTFEQTASGNGLTGLTTGEEFANKYIPPAQQISTETPQGVQAAGQALTGNVGTNQTTQGALATQQGYTQRSGDQQDVLNQERNLATQGYGAPEYQAEREQQLQGQASQFKTAQNSLAKAQAQGKVYGAAGAAQMANLNNANLNAGYNNEQQLMINEAGVKNAALQNYSGALNAQNSQLASNANAYTQAAQGEQQNQQARAQSAATQQNTQAAAQTDANKFNVGEQDATTAAKLGAITNVAGLESANQINKEQNAIGADAVAADGGKLTNYNAAVNAAKQQAQTESAGSVGLQNPTNPGASNPAPAASTAAHTTADGITRNPDGSYSSNGKVISGATSLSAARAQLAKKAAK